MNNCVKHYYIVDGKLIISEKEIGEHDGKLHAKLFFIDKKYELHLSFSNHTKSNKYVTEIIEADKEFITKLNNFKKIPVYLRHVKKLFDINELQNWIEIDKK